MHSTPINLDDKLVCDGWFAWRLQQRIRFSLSPACPHQYNPNEIVHFRLSAGKGYRTNHVLAENNYLLAKRSPVTIADNFRSGRSMELWCQCLHIHSFVWQNVECEYGILLHRLPATKWWIWHGCNPHEIAFTNLDGKSLLKAFQVEASYPFFGRICIAGCLPFNGCQNHVQRSIRWWNHWPVSTKGLITASYQTPAGYLAVWHHLQLNGGGRMPQSLCVGRRIPHRGAADTVPLNS